MITLFYGKSIDMNAEGLQSILQLAEGDASVLMEIIFDSLQYTPQLMDNLTQAVEQEDAKKIKLSAHSLKSSSAQIGALIMADFCHHLEMKSADGDISEAKQYLQQIYQEYDNVQKELNEWKNQLGV
jgi:HPt (histidine-containing phosphotransfer) domain-containing protein